MALEHDMRMLLAMTLTLAAGAASAVTGDGVDALSAEARATHAQSIAIWRAERVARLTQPDGWLSLVGLHWIEPGSHRLGRAPDSDIVLGTGPAHLGTLISDGDAFTLTLADGVDARIGDTPARSAKLVADADGAPTLVRFGKASFTLIQRGDRYALRVRDPDAPTRRDFAGIDAFPTDPAWRFDARFVAHPEGRTIEIASIIGTLEAMKNPGALAFTRGGKDYRLEAIDDGSGQLFVIFADRTSGRETYGPGRFVYAELPQDGRTVLDFNRAYNPPCAFSAFSTCPLPPPENRLDLAVTAGEKTYRGAHGGTAP